MRKSIDDLNIADIIRLRKCHIYSVSTLNEVRVCINDIALMRKKLEILFSKSRVNQAFVERMLILYLLFGESVCPV